MSSIDERFPQPLLLGGGAQPNGLASLSTGHSESLVDTFFASHQLLVSNFYQWRPAPFFGVVTFLGQRGSASWAASRLAVAMLIITLCRSWHRWSPARCFIWVARPVVPVSLPSPLPGFPVPGNDGAYPGLIATICLNAIGPACTLGSP